MVRPGSDSGMRKRTTATLALNDCIPCRPRNRPRLGGRGDSLWCGDADGFSQTVIPAKGEAREPGTMYQPVRDFEMGPGCRLSRGSSGVT